MCPANISGLNGPLGLVHCVQTLDELSPATRRLLLWCLPCALWAPRPCLCVVWVGTSGAVGWRPPAANMKENAPLQAAARAPGGRTRQILWN